MAARSVRGLKLCELCPQKNFLSLISKELFFKGLQRLWVRTYKTQQRLRALFLHVFAARIASISFNAPPFVHLISFCCKLSFLVMKIDKENVFVSLHEIADFSTLYMQSVIYLKKNTSVNVCLLEQMYSKRVLLEPLLSNERNARCCRRTLHRTLQDVCTLTTFSMSIYACIMYWTFSLHSSLQSQSIDYPSLRFSIA